MRQVVLQVRVLGRDGWPVLGLARENFRVSVDGKPVAVESARWVDSGEMGSSPGENHGGRLVTILVQRDMQRARLSGLMAYKGWAARLVESLPAHDHVALLVQDSRLYVYSDLTPDHGAVARLLRTGLFRPPPKTPPAPGRASVLPLLPESAQAAAATREKGLLLLARALAQLPGERVVLLLGWGLGRFSYPGFDLPGEYLEAVALLAAEQVQVFALDITDADFHTLELGLVQVAEDTGGLYAKTHLFPATATGRVLGALSGYYELAFPRPPLPEGVHRVEVELAGASGTVLCRRTFADPPSVGLP
ncbi:MAG: hypothetical protein ACP5NF_05350 [Thermoanaerobaculum sp.]